MFISYKKYNNEKLDLPKSIIRVYRNIRYKIKAILKREEPTDPEAYIFDKLKTPDNAVEKEVDLIIFRKNLLTALPDSDKAIYLLKIINYTEEEIAGIMHLKTHSAISKRLKKIVEIAGKIYKGESNVKR